MDLEIRYENGSMTVHLEEFLFEHPQHCQGQETAETYQKQFHPGM